VHRADPHRHEARFVLGQLLVKKGRPPKGRKIRWCMIGNFGHPLSMPMAALGCKGPWHPRRGQMTPRISALSPQRRKA
jgi:hypothetical protein